MVRSFALAALLILPTGCTAIPIIAGTHPPIERLESSLVVGKDGYGQVLEVLGIPDGQGRALMPMANEVRPLWNYQFQTGTPEDLQLAVVLVFFNNRGIYDGYLWFSSVPRDR